MQGNIYGRRPVTSSLNTTKRLWKSKFYIVGICCQSIFRNWSFPDFCIAHSFASLSLSVILLLVLDSRYLFRLSVHCHCPGQFAHYATIFELVLSECLMQNHFSPKTLGRACLSYSAVVHCTSRLSPFINNLFDWWTLRMTTMSTSSPSIIIIAYFSKTNLWNMSNLALCITLSDLSSICLYYKIFKRAKLLTWPFLNDSRYVLCSQSLTLAARQQYKSSRTKCFTISTREVSISVPIQKFLRFQNTILFTYLHPEVNVSAMNFKYWATSKETTPIKIHSPL